MFTRGTCPTVDTLEKICDAFGISLSEFFEEDDRKAHVSKEELELLRKYRALPTKKKTLSNQQSTPYFKNKCSKLVVIKAFAMPA